MKNIYIDMYNCILAYHTFKKGKVTHDDWVFPPPCMQDNTYNYVVFFYEWIFGGKWRMNSSKDSYNSYKDNNE